MNLRLLWLLAALGAITATTAAAQAGAAGAPAKETPAAVIHESFWDAGEVGSWSAFTVRVTSERGLQGELWLVPTSSRPQRAGEPPLPEEQLPTPTLRAPLTLEPGSERFVSVMAPVGEEAYRAEMRDGSGRLVSQGVARKAAGRATFDIGVLTERTGTNAVVQGGSQVQMGISRRFRSAADFPADVLSLQGLEAIVIADFDSAALSVQQRQALQDFVAVGGSLVITGGSAAGRTLGALPEALVPLRPDATVAASLAPLADLVAQTTTAVTTVTTGHLRSGQVVVGGPSGPPLVVEAPYGLGLVVQLTYDPFAVSDEHETATVALRTVAWSVGLGRAAAASQPSPELVGGESAGGPGRTWEVFDQVPGPASPGTPTMLLLMAYALMMGAAVFYLGRGRHLPPWLWAGVPGMAVVVALAMVALRSTTLTGYELTVERWGRVPSPVPVESFHHLVPSGPGDMTLGLGRETLATTAPDPRPPTGGSAFPGIVSDFPRIPRELRWSPDANSDVIDLDAGATVELASLQAWEPRRLHTLSVSPRRGWLEAHLRLEGGRVVGSVTNHGDRPLRRVRIQSPDGIQAELAAELAPGANVAVDAAFGPGAPPGEGDVGASVLDAAASLKPGELRPGELVVVGLLAEEPALAGRKDIRSDRAYRAVVTTVDLEAADDFVLVRLGDISGNLNFGVPKAFCCGAAGVGNVYDLRLPDRARGAFALTEPKPDPAMPSSIPPVQVAIYDWTNASWRTLVRDAGGFMSIAPAEIRDGLVRIRLPGTSRDLTAVARPAG